MRKRKYRRSAKRARTTGFTSFISGFVSLRYENSRHSRSPAGPDLDQRYTQQEAGRTYQVEWYLLDTNAAPLVPTKSSGIPAASGKGTYQVEWYLPVAMRGAVFFLYYRREST
jgi:hypothetical protein